ncbi:MAG: M48 family metallopeptidase [Rubellimicrobium sp.]|nr:M48 family metallopeptidase [Rubellimicrobium sp.]
MLRLAPILLAVLYGLVAWRFAAWRTRAELDARSRPLADPALAPVMTRLARALDLPRLAVNLYDIAPVNGLAAADGRIYITRGLHDAFRAGQVTAEELASVVAHELGHVALGHTRRRMIDFSGQNALRAVLAAFLTRLLPGLGGWLAGLATTLLAARLSRADEYEADAWATALLLKSGIDAGAQVALLEKLDRLTGTGGAVSAAWTATHPPTADRIARIRGNIARWAPAARPPALRPPAVRPPEPRA